MRQSKANNRKIISLLSVALATSSCAFSKDSKDKKDENNKEVVINVEENIGDFLNASQFNIQIRERNENAINDYVARVSWPQNKKANIVITLEGKQNSEPVINALEESFTDVPCPSGSKLKFEIKATPHHVEAHSAIFTTDELSCPKDFVVTGKMNPGFSLGEKIQKLILEKNSTLVLDEKTYLIIEELTFTGGARISSTGTRTENIDNQSRDSDIRLDIRKIQTDRDSTTNILNLTLFGRDGDNGRSFDESKPRAQSSGPRKKIGSEDYVSIPQKNGLRPIIVSTKPSSCPSTLPDVEIANGKDGANTPSVDINVLEATNIHIEVIGTPGRGGHGAPGILCDRENEHPGQPLQYETLNGERGTHGVFKRVKITEGVSRHDTEISPQ